ncbi:hypothetical protein E0K89_013710 [Aquicoccus sp. SCR17]|nr:hypothetical protein [Carideicomes alvinocaridis]
MSSPDRRAFLTLLAAGGLSACGFTPAYGPSGGAGRLQGQVAVDAPDDRAGYLLVRRLEERLGRAAGARYELGAQVVIDEEGLGISADQRTTRYHLVGEARYALRDAATGLVLQSGQVESFTGYSATGSTVATLAAERDALERLMTILADRITDRLIAGAADLPA